MTRWVLHVDMDQFLVAVELLRRPDLAGLPVVVGGRGDPGERAVVSTASYEAREFGVHSGLALKLARKRCPEAVFLPVDFPHYEAASATVMAALRSMPGSVVQVLGWDEAFVGFELEDSVDPMELAESARAAVMVASGLSCSVGVGDTLVRAKTATGFGKPAGTYRLTKENWLAVMGGRDTQSLWGVGPRIGARLASLGIATVAELAAAPVDGLVAEFGNVGGRHVSSLGRGEGRSWPDDSPWVARAHGRETTYQRDLATRDEIADALLDLSRRVVDDITADTAGVADGKPAGRRVARVFLKVRFAPFFTYQRSRKLRSPTTDPAVVAATALSLYDALGDERAVRLLGVRGEMTDPAAPDDSGAPGAAGSPARVISPDEATAVHKAVSRGVSVDADSCDPDNLCFAGAVTVTAPGSESWHALVERAGVEGWGGIDALGGHHGTVAEAIEANHRHDGQSVGDAIWSIRTWDRVEDAQRTFAAVDCGFRVGGSRFTLTAGGSHRFTIIDATFLLPLR